jgi:hypothetical protein
MGVACYRWADRGHPWVVGSGAAWWGRALKVGVDVADGVADHIFVLALPWQCKHTHRETEGHVVTNAHEQSHTQSQRLA